jgi:hypothetical protein
MNLPRRCSIRPLVAIDAQLDTLLIQDKVGSRFSRIDPPPAPSHPLLPASLKTTPAGKTTAREISS